MPLTGCHWRTRQCGIPRGSCVALSGFDVAFLMDYEYRSKYSIRCTWPHAALVFAVRTGRSDSHRFHTRRCLLRIRDGSFGSPYDAYSKRSTGACASGTRAGGSCVLPCRERSRLCFVLAPRRPRLAKRYVACKTLTGKPLAMTTTPIYPRKYRQNRDRRA